MLIYKGNYKIHLIIYAIAFFILSLISKVLVLLLISSYPIFYYYRFVLIFIIALFKILGLSLTIFEFGIRSLLYLLHS